MWICNEVHLVQFDSLKSLMGNPIENVSELLLWVHAIDRGESTDKFKGVLFVTITLRIKRSSTGNCDFSDK